MVSALVKDSRYEYTRFHCNGRLEKIEDLQCGIYCWTNKVNGKMYIGRSINLTERKTDFLRFESLYAGELINRARAKYNNKNYWLYRILEFTTDNNDDINNREIKYIKLYKTTNKTVGYNLANGGGGNSGYRFSEEAKLKMSEKRKGRHHSDEFKHYLSELKKGKPQPHFNKCIIQYSKDSEFIKEWESVSEASKSLGINLTVISNCLKGRYKSAGGYKWSYKGEIMSDKWKNESIGQVSKRICQIDKESNNIIRTFNGIAELVAKTGFGRDGIYKCLNGKQRQYNGFKWAYEGTDLNDDWIIRTNEYTRGRVLQINPKTNKIVNVWIRIQAAADYLNKDQANISACCRGLRQTAYGFIWRYADNSL